jgi:hypothetical protein
VNKIFLPAGVFLLNAFCCRAYGPNGHEIVGGIADKLIANTPAAEKIYALTDGITLERAAAIADEIKAWDKNGVDDRDAFPHYSEHPNIDKQLRDFWTANPPTQDANSAVPSHHWFHYTDVPIVNAQKYGDGKTGRSKWDIVHMISYCVDVLRGEVSESNSRKITRPIAVILLAHYVGDIHQPLHVGAEYFNDAGQPVDPDKNQRGTEDEGGNSIFLRLAHGTPDQLAHKGLKLHGFWDNDAVLANFAQLSPTLSKEERYQQLQHSEHALINRLAREQPQNWRVPADVALNKYGEVWANDILPIAREAHQRLRFVYMHSAVDQGRTVMAGDARENPPADGIPYADWSAKVVRDELHKAGWRLADLLTRAVTSKDINSTAAIASPESPQSRPAQKINNAMLETATADSKAPGAGSGGEFGAYPGNYKEIVTAWLKKYALDVSAIDWQTEPKPAEMPNASGQRFSGYLVIFNTPDHGTFKTRSVLIRDGVIVSNSGF